MSASAERRAPRIRRFLIPLAVLAAAGCLLLMLTYEVIYIDVVSFMEDQPSVGYQAPPRRLPPAEAVPVSRPSYLDEPASLVNPVPADDVSLERGAQLFGYHCAVCHGTLGGWDASSYDAVIYTGDNAPVVIFGDVENSLLAQKIIGTQTFGSIMPPAGLMADSEIQIVLDWIMAGAPNN